MLPLRLIKFTAAVAIVASVFAPGTPLPVPVAYAQGVTGGGSASAGASVGTINTGSTANSGNVSATGNTGASTTGTDLECSTSNISLCISGFVYWITVGVGSWTANIAAYVFDYAVMLSLQSGAYALDVIAVGWGIVRDVANMSFLFILVYIAFKIMFQAETTGTTRMLVWVVIVALLVNFSFVMTRVVIDAGNIVALQFYNAIASASPAINTNNNQQTNAVTGGIPVKDITSSIMTALNPQDIIGGGQFKNFIANPNNSPMYYLIVSSVVYILMGVSLFMVAAVFIFAAVRFVTRVIGLAGLIMIAPAAFVAAIFRGKEGGAKWFNMWLGYLIEFTFYPAVFLFLFYIEVRFMQDMNSVAGKVNLFNGAFNAAGTGTQSWTLIAQALANVGIRLAYIIASLYLILRVSMWSSQAFKAAGTSWAERGLFALGRGTLRGAIGTTAFIGRNSLGATGRIRGNALLASGTYDIRNAPLVRTLVGNSLGKPTPASRAYGLATRDTPEGRKAAEEARTKKAAADKQERERQARVEAKHAAEREANQQGNAGAGATGSAGSATTSTNPAATPAARKIPAGRMTSAPGTTAAANPNQAVRPRLQSGPGLAPANLNNLGKILEAVKKSNAEKGQPIFNKANAPIINANFKTNVQQVMKEPIFNAPNQPALNQSSQWGGAPAAAARATVAAATVAAAAPDMSRSASAGPHMDESRRESADASALREGIKGLGEAVRQMTTAANNGAALPQKFVIAPQAHTGPTTAEHVAAGSVHLSKEDAKKIAGEVAHELESKMPDNDGGGSGPAAPAAAKPTQQAHNDDYPYSQAAE